MHDYVKYFLVYEKKKKRIKKYVSNNLFFIENKSDEKNGLFFLFDNYSKIIHIICIRRLFIINEKNFFQHYLVNKF